MIDRILSRAKELGVTQAHICSQIGHGRTWLQSVKHYDLQIDDNKAEAIASILHTTVDYLKGNTDDPSPDNKKSPSVQDELTDKEAVMLQLFRSASPEFQERYLSLLEVALKEASITQ